MLTAAIADCPLFAGIEAEQLDSLLDCLSARKIVREKDAYIFTAGDPALYVGILATGGAYVIQDDFWGGRTILAYVGPGELFGEAFSCGGTARLPVSVVAAEKSEILLVDYRKIVTTCSAACTFHSHLLANMLGILAGKNILLTQKMGFLSRRTIQEKLLAFLSAQSMSSGSNEVEIPFNRQELADYLCVERSALSRVLGEMEKKGILRYHKNRFILAVPPEPV